MDAKVARYVMDTPPPRAGARRLHLNEFRFPHHEAVLGAAKSAVTTELLTEYTTEAPRDLVAALAEYTGAAPEHVFVGAGSDDVLQAVVRYCAHAGIKDVVGGVPTYTHFVLFAEQSLMRWHPVSIPCSATPADRKALIELEAPLLDKGALVYLVSPNNPTGALWDRDTVAAWAARFPRSVFLVDEAYTEFAGIEKTAAAEWLPNPTDLSCTGIDKQRGGHKVIAKIMNSASLSPLAAEQKNVVVTRTLSKAFGLAGLRVGYGIARAADALSAFLSPKAVTRLAAAAGVACLGRHVLSHYFGCAWVAVRERNRLRDGLAAAGWRVAAGAGNFLLLYTGDSPAVKKLQGAAVIVRDRSSLPGLTGFVRITAGAPEDTDAVLKALADISPPAAPIQSRFAAPALVVRLREYLAVTRMILNAVGITWWAEWGTLLGAMRHGGIIPWDDDIDLGYVFSPSEAEEGDKTVAVDPVAGLVGAFAERGLTLRRNRTDAYWQIGRDLPANPTSSVHECIDLLPYHFDRESKMFLNADPRFRHETTEQANCNTRYARDELFPLRAVPFYSETIAVPARAEDALVRAVGAAWKTEGVLRDGTRIAIVDRSPA